MEAPTRPGLLRAGSKIARLGRGLTTGTPEDGQCSQAAAELIDIVAAARDIRGLFRKRRERRAVAAAALLLRSWPDLDPQCRDTLMAVGGEPLKRAIDALAASRREERLIVARLGEEAPRGATLRAAARLLADEDEDVAARAERTLVGVADRREQLREGEFLALDQAMALAAETFSAHRRRGALRPIALLAAAPGPRLRAWLDAEEDAGHLGLRALLRRGGDEELRGAAVSLLKTPSLSGAALDLLCQPSPTGPSEATLAMGHLLLDPGRRRRLRATPRAVATLPPPGDARDLSDTAQRGVIRWIEALPLTIGERAASLAGFVDDPDEVVRHGAVRGLERLVGDSREARRALLDYAFDPDPRIARHAAMRLGVLDAPEGDTLRTLERLRRSPHAAVRTLARESVAANDVWDAAGPADGWRRLVAARRAMERDRAGFLAEVEARLGSDDRAVRLIAITFIKRFGIGSRMEGALIAASRGDDAFVASSAVRALARLETGSARGAIESALEHEDARVRADAIEALASFSPDSSRFVAGLRDDAPRIRANTIRALLLRDKSAGSERCFDGASASSELAEMLADARVEHRRAALWLAEREAPTALAQRVAELARDEPDPAVRDRARRTARRLLARMRAAWAVAPVSLDGSASRGEEPADARSTSSM